MSFFRFLYINIYAFLLIGLSVIVFCMPQNVFVAILKTICVLMPLAGGISIFSQWKLKNGKLKILIARNAKHLRLDTFDQLKETPCGRVVADIALREMRKTATYKALSKTTWKKIRTAVLGIKLGGFVSASRRLR